MAKSKNKKEVIFEADEMQLKEVDPNWSPEYLLAQESIFFLKDVVKVLQIDSIKVKKKARELNQKHKSPWERMGVRKIWNHWIVRMKVFGPFYRKHLVSRVKNIQEDWDGNDLLKQKGLFFLTDVCKLIPFSTYQLRYQAKKNPAAKKEYGVWKDKELNAYVVDMELFAPWIFSLWEGKYQS